MNAGASARSHQEHEEPATENPNAHRIEQMFDAHYDAIWRTLRRLGIAAANADDAAQKVFVIASRRVAEIIVGQEGRYLYGVAMKVASEMRRRDPARHEISGDDMLDAIADDANGPEATLLESEARDALDESLAGMADELRAVLVLVEIEGLSLPELAAVLEVPLGTATSRLRRAREAFSASARRVRARLSGGTNGTSHGGPR